MKREKKILAYVAATALLWGTGGTLALAAQHVGGFIPLVSIPGVKPGVDFATFFNSLFRLFIAAAAAIAIVRIVWAGFKYMTVESIRGKGESREKILDALIGLLLALGTFMLLSIINPNLTNITGGVTVVKIKGEELAPVQPTQNASVLMEKAFSAPLISRFEFSAKETATPAGGTVIGGGFGPPFGTGLLDVISGKYTPVRTVEYVIAPDKLNTEEKMVAVEKETNTFYNQCSGQAGQISKKIEAGKGVVFSCEIIERKK